LSNFNFENVTLEDGVVKTTLSIALLMFITVTTMLSSVGQAQGGPTARTNVGVAERYTVTPADSPLPAVKGSSCQLCRSDLPRAMPRATG